MKKKPIIVSSLVMCLIIAIALISVSVAWFGNVLSANDKIIISSEKPKGTAIISVDAASNSSDFGDMLVPAIANPGVWLSGNYGNVDVLDPSFVGALQDNKPLKANATTVTIVFPYSYVGAPDDEFTGKKAVRLTFDGVFLEDPTEVGTDSILNYLEEFSFTIATVLPETDATGNVMHDAKGNILISKDEDGNFIKDLDVNQTLNENKLDVAVIPGLDYYCAIVVNFRKVDEECDPTLRDYLSNKVKLFMLFVIESL